MANKTLFALVLVLCLIVPMRAQIIQNTVRQPVFQASVPSCTSNCGTSPSVSGMDSSFTLTMGASGSPASGFVVTFGAAWASAPQCTGAMAKTGMAVGKMALTLVTTTTTLTVVTNGTAPATTDVYHFQCSLGL